MTGNSYTLEMDSVRFGRALGVGARAAAKTLVTAVDAATAPNPSAPAKTISTTAHPKEASAEAQPAETKARASGARLGQQAVRTTAQVKQTGKGLKQGGKRFGEAVWGPFAKLSGVLWHEIMGVLFGMFAAVSGVEAWNGRGSLRVGAAGRTHELFAIAMVAGFGYFTVSSFVRASRRQRR